MVDDIKPEAVNVEIMLCIRNRRDAGHCRIVRFASGKPGGEGAAAR
jgi:hypothetical protein